MIVPYLNDLVILDSWFDTKTPEEIKAWIEDWCKTNWVKEEIVWICPLSDGHISFGMEPNWREEHSNG